MEEKTWKEFKETGLLWFINSLLHLFGWAIVIERNEDKNTRVYPARVNFRGFSESSNTNGYINISNYLQKNINDLVEEAYGKK